MRIVFMGTPALAVPALEKLIASRHEVAAVVTQPDRASGRGRSVTFSPVKQCALEHGLELLQPESVSTEEVLDTLESFHADIFAVVAFAQKLPERLLTMAPFGCINMHPSLLPKYRGSAPFRGPILNGDEETGVTIMQLVEKWDAGDILLQESFPIDETDTALTIEEKAVPLGAELLLKTIDGLEAGTITPVPQDESKATYLKQIKKEDGLIDFSAPAVMIDRQIRACIPWPSAYTYLEGKLFKIWSAEPVADMMEKGVCGSVAASEKGSIVIQCGEGCLRLKDVQIEGKKRMPVEDFLKGRKVEPGTVFGQ